MSTMREDVIKSVTSVTGKGYDYVSNLYDVINSEDEYDVCKELLFDLGISYGMSAEMYVIVEKSTDPIDLLINFGIDHPYLEVALLFADKNWPEVRLNIRSNDVPNIYLHERICLSRGKKERYRKFLEKYLEPTRNSSWCKPVLPY